VARHRFNHYHGETFARLDRGQKRLASKPRTKSCLLRGCFFAMLGFPEYLESQLDSLFTDDIVYEIHWKKFAHSLVKNWKDSYHVSIGLLMTNALLLAFCKTPISIFPGLGSTLCSVGGVFFGFAMQNKYLELENMGCTSAVDYLSAIEHKTLGFGPVAAWYTLPRAANSWAVILLVMEVINISIETGGYLVVAIPAVIIAICCIVVGVMWIYTATRKNFAATPKDLESRSKICSSSLLPFCVDQGLDPS